MEHIQLCGKTIPVYPLKIWRIKRRVIGPLLDFVSSNSDGSSVDLSLSGFSLGTVDAKAYDILLLLAPKVEQYVPLHEFLGYQTADAMAVDDHPEDDDLGTDIPEVEAAIKTAIRVSRLDILGEVKHIVDPEAARELVTEVFRDLKDEAMDKVRAQLSTNSAS